MKTMFELGTVSDGVVAIVDPDNVSAIFTNEEDAEYFLTVTTKDEKSYQCDHLYRYEGELSKPAQDNFDPFILKAQNKPDEYI